MKLEPPDAVARLAPQWLGVAARVILAVYLVELVFNRMLFRTLVFIPPGPVQDVVGDVVTLVGVASLNMLVLAGLLTLLLTPLRMDRRLSHVPLLIAAVVALDLAFGLVESRWALPLLAAYTAGLQPWRLPEAAYQVLLALTGGSIGLDIWSTASLLWLLLPLPYLAWRGSIEWRWVKRSLPIAALALLLVAGNTYIMGEILVFAMGLASPWLLPPAILLYAATGSRAMLGVLLTGPILQLSSQVVALASLYLLELNLLPALKGEGSL